MFKLKHLYMITLLLGASSVSAQTPQQWRDSLSVLSKQISQSVYSADLHLKKAAVNLQLQEWNYAIEEYNLVLRNDPKNLAALFYRAFANNNLRHYDLVKNDYEAFLKIAPRNMEARLGLANVYIKLNRHTEAMNMMNNLVESYPDSSVVYAARAGLEKDLKFYDAALYDWNEAIRLKPDNRDFVISKVDILLMMSNKKEAKLVLDETVRKGTPKGILREWYLKCK